jgi:hypothetical protein
VLYGWSKMRMCGELEQGLGPEPELSDTVQWVREGLAGDDVMPLFGRFSSSFILEGEISIGFICDNGRTPSLLLLFSSFFYSIL